jgi:hypothetical protein
VYAGLGAIAITVIGYGIACRQRGVCFFHQPGHWLLADIAAMTIVAWLPMIGFRLANVLSSSLQDVDKAEHVMVVLGVISIVCVLHWRSVYEIAEIFDLTQSDATDDSADGTKSFANRAINPP